MRKNHPFRYLCIALCIMLMSAAMPAFAADPTPSPTPLAISKPVSLSVATPTPTPTPELTATPEPTNTPEPTAVPENNNAPTATPESGNSATPEVTVTPSPEEGDSPTPTIDTAATPDPDASVSPTPTIDPDASASPTPTIDPDATSDPAAGTSPTPTVDPDASAVPGLMFSIFKGLPNQKIKRFDALEPASVEVYQKPGLDEVIAYLPDELGVVFLVETMPEDDGAGQEGGDAENPEGGAEETPAEPITTEVPGKVPVVWSYAGEDDYDARTEGEFVFAAQLPETGYVLADETVQMPRFTLIVSTSMTFGDYQAVLSEDNELTIVAWNGSESALVVPASLGEEGYPVTAIAAEAFANKTGLRSAELPMGIENIGGRLFAGCAALEKVIIPDTLQSVGSDLFAGCSALESVVLRTKNGSTLTAPDAFEYTSVDEDDASNMEKHSIKLSATFTDIEVKAKTFTLDCDFEVQAEHGITVDSGAGMQISSGKTLRNFGAIANNGSMNNSGTIITCAGVFSGNECQNLEGSVYIYEHAYEEDVCTGCGQDKPVEEEPTEEPTATPTVAPTKEPSITKLEVRYVGSTPSKTYDGTKNVTVKASDFALKGIASGHDVRITAIKAAYDSANAGSRTVKATLTLGGAQAAYYSCAPITINASIQPKKLTITPNPGQGKIFGAADPSTYTGRVKGLLEGDLLTGRLSREPGEKAGQYKILQGTINGGNNYTISMAEVYFTIQPKSINSTDVGMVTIGNQRYTGAAVTPAVTLRHGSKTLEPGIDFTISYSNNVQPGTATVRVCGIGDYSGERTATFRILKVSAGVDYTGGYTGGNSGYTGPQISGSYTSGGGTLGSTGFYAGDESYYPEVTYDMPSGMDEAVTSLDSYEGSLVLGENDYGSILFNELDEPRPFSLFEEEMEEQPQGTNPDKPLKRLRIIPEPAIHEYTEDILYLDDGREMYEELHLKLSVELVEELRAENFAEISYELEDAVLRISLDELNGEVFIETEMEDDDSEEYSAGSIAGVISNLTMNLFDDESEEDEMEESAESIITVSGYDFCIQQIAPNGLTERETIALQDYDLVTNAYRINIVAEKSKTDAQGNEIIYEYPVLDQMSEISLMIMPFDDLGEDLGAYQEIWVSDDPELDETDPEVFLNSYMEAKFIYENDEIYAFIVPAASGFYAVGSGNTAETIAAQ